MTPTPRVSVLIPAARQPERLERCLDALARDGCESTREILVLLNGATPEVRAVAAAARGVRVLESELDLGVAAAYNRLRAVARGDFLALTHDDTEMQPGWQDHLVATLDARPEAGLVGGLVLWPDGGLRSSGEVLWRDPTTTPCWRGSPPSPEACTAIEPVDYVAGSFVFVRASTFDRIGGLDESIYPAYWVDVSLALAVRASGQIVLFDPRARQVHHEGTLRGGYRSFVLRRNAARVKARWERQLARDHEPFADSDEAWSAARRSTLAVAARITAARRWVDADEPPPFAVRPIDQERRVLRLKAELSKAWADELEAEIERRRTQHDDLRREAEEAAQRCAELAERLAALEGELARQGLEPKRTVQAGAPDATELEGLRALAATRWVRLYVRLAPTLSKLLRPFLRQR